MSHNLTDADAFPAVPVPDGTDSRNDAANKVEALGQALANRTRWLALRLVELGLNIARTNLANVFTEPQTIPNIAGSTVVEANLTVNGETRVPWIKDAVEIAGSLDVTGDISAHDDVIAQDEFQYWRDPWPQRTVLIPLLSCFGEGLLDMSGGGAVARVNLGAGKVHLWPIKLPRDATLLSVQALAAKSGGNALTMKVVRKQNGDWSATPSSMPGSFDRGSPHAVTGSGLKMLDVTLPANETIDNEDIEWFVHITSTDGSDHVYALRMTFLDPGPRNH
jgi:hypothetical protein